jgi:hypothetical protein
MSRASVFSSMSGNRGLPTYAGKVLCVLIAVAFGTSLAQAVPLPGQIDNWDNPFPGTITTGTSFGSVISQSNSPITADSYFGTVTRTVTVVNGSSLPPVQIPPLALNSSATILNNELCFYLTPGGSLTLEYQFSQGVSFNQSLLSAFFSNESIYPYTVDVSYDVFGGPTTWIPSGTVTIPGNEPVLEPYSLSLGSGINPVGGLLLVYSFPFGGGEGCLCGVSQVPEIDPATGSSALSLVAGVLAMIEQRRRRAALVA